MVSHSGAVCRTTWFPMKLKIHIKKEQEKSMNIDEGSYQLSHVYDNLFAPKLSGERRVVTLATILSPRRQAVAI